MEGKSNCELCGTEFQWKRYKTQTIARFCGKRCWYEWNAKNLSAFNETRFQWNTATEEEKLEQLKKNYESKVVKKDGCWDWNGVKDKDGYGQVPSGYHKQGKAHRISWMLHKGEIPEGLIICHHCDNPKCTNPDHLFLGEKKDNNADKEKKGRGAKGSKIKTAKLNEESIVLIRKLLKIGVKSRRVAKDFGVSPSQICAINKGKSWKHVTI